MNIINKVTEPNEGNIRIYIELNKHMIMFFDEVVEGLISQNKDIFFLFDIDSQSKNEDTKEKISSHILNIFINIYFNT